MPFSDQRKAAAARRRYDIVLYGATGFVGRQTVAYLAGHPQVRSAGLNLALAGRNRDKLEQVRRECAGTLPKAGVLVAAADDTRALNALARQASVVLSTAGPFGHEPAMWHYGFLFSPALTVGGGTGEVQRNIVAERVLGLPHDVEVDPGRTWAASR